MKKTRSLILGFAAAIALSVSAVGPAVAATSSVGSQPETTVSAQANESILRGPTPCDGPLTVRFTQSGGTSKIQNCRATTIKAQFVSNSAILGVVYSACYSIAPAGSKTASDTLVEFVKSWRYC